MSRRRSGRGGSPFLLETLPAKYWPALCRLERNSRFLAASRTIGAGLDLGVTGSRSSAHACGPFGLARLAALGLVLELFVVEEELFPGSEDEIAAAIDTLQNLVLEFHGELLPTVHDPSDRQGTLRIPQEPD